MTVNNLAEIRVESSSDCGCNCDWTDKEKSDFCDYVVSALESVFPGVEVECDIVDRTETRVFVYGKEKRIGLVTHPEPEDDLKTTIKGIVQEVWDKGDFWGPVDTDVTD